MTMAHRELAREPEEAPTSERSTRVVSDEEGKLWRVREVRFADAAPSLIFECEIGFRRVRVYPRNWQSLPEMELYALSWRT